MSVPSSTTPRILFCPKCGIPVEIRIRVTAYGNEEVGTFLDVENASDGHHECVYQSASEGEADE